MRASARALFDDYRAFAGWKLPAALALMVGSAIAEGVGILMMVPLIVFATGSAALPDELSFLSDMMAATSPDRRLIAALALFVGTMSLRSILLYLRDVLLVQLQVGHAASMQVRAGAKLATLGWSFASRVGQADMQSLLLNDIDRAALAVYYGQRACVAAVLLVVNLLLAAYLSLPMAVIALGVTATGYAFGWRFIRRGFRRGTAVSDAYADSTNAGFRLHAILKTALAHGTVPQFLAEYRQSLSRMVSVNVAAARDSAFTMAAAGVASALAASLLLLIGLYVAAVPFALLVPLLVIFARMNGPALLLQQSVQYAAGAVPAFGALEHKVGALPGLMNLSAFRRFGVDVRDVMGSRRLTELCLRLPLQHYAYRGTDRRLARALLQGRVPDRVHREARRGLQGGNWRVALEANRGALNDAVDELAGDPLLSELVDVERLRHLIANWPQTGWQDQHQITTYRYAVMRPLVASRFARWVRRQPAAAVPLV